MAKVKSEKKRITLLIWLCWLVYMCSYLGKVNYSANITQIEAFYGISHASAGMVGTFFFFAYGAGQIFNGVFCKKYNIKWMRFGALTVCGVCNLLVGLAPNFAIVKYVWLLNGLAMSVLWPTLIRLLSETLPRESMARASVVLGTTVATGTLIIYGLSALFAELQVFKLAFFLPAVVLPAVGVIWLCAFSPLTKIKAVPVETEKREETAPQEKGKMPRDLLRSICILAVFAVATNLVKDGLTTWVPSILKENYGMPDSFSILLTLLLPMVAVFGNFFAVQLHKKVSDFVLQCGTGFLLAGVLVGGVIGLLSTKLVIVTLIGFALVNFLVSSSNSTITSIFPLFMKGKVNSGLIAGVLNGCCYVGSTISSYGLGALADSFGWNTVFYVLLAVCCAVVLTAAVYWLIGFLKRKKEK